MGISRDLLLVRNGAKDLYSPFEIKMADPWDYITSLGIKHFNWKDSFYAEGNKICHFLEKVPCVDLDDENVLHDDYGPIICSIPQCKQSFDTVAEHAAHQRICHSFMCSSCHNSFPTDHLLDLHLQEVHDSYFFVMAQKKPMYRCLLETCTEVFQDQKERKVHCINDHKFPSDFRYDPSWRKLGKVSKNSKDKKQQEFSSSMDCDEIETKDSDAQERSTSFINKRESLHITRTFGTGIPRGFPRPRVRNNRGKSRMPNAFYQKGPRKREEGKIDMKDVEKALVDNVSDTMQDD
ncbi:zinc finger protein 511-like isoform X2 [Macrobrachium nipponense]|uniref:zinc finger protein 511-like isoform X2 n=1 Tax=Macrobrachium nipponense TaxID=159736 RepID=UPI0030C7A157